MGQSLVSVVLQNPVSIMLLIGIGSFIYGNALVGAFFFILGLVMFFYQHR